MRPVSEGIAKHAVGMITVSEEITVQTISENKSKWEGSRENLNDEPRD
jgi:hypothetical protein